MIRRTLAVVFPLLILAVPFAQQPTPRELFERARILDESNRSLEEAVTLYGRVAAQATDRQLAADAELRAGLLHERLGRSSEAQRAFARVVGQYADQPDVVRRAQARLAIMAESSSEAMAVARRVWAGREVSYAAAAAPNGQFLTVQDMATGDLAVHEIHSGRMRRVTATKEPWSGFALGSVISPDSTRVAYTWATTQPKIVYELRTSSMSGGEPKVLYRNPEDAFVSPYAWMPDGSAILTAIWRKDLSTQIAFISTRDGAVRALKTLDWQTAAGISLSPDGRWIAYAALPSQNAHTNDIFLLDTRGVSERALIAHAADDISPMWTPDGAGVVFLSDRSGAIGAWFVPVADGRRAGEPQLVKPDLGRRVFPLGISASGAYFYAVESGGGDVAILPFDGVGAKTTSAPRVISHRFVGTNEWPAWSPDGATIAYLSNRGQMSPRTFVLHNLASGAERDIALPSGYRARVPRWSPDGRSIVFVGSDDRSRPGLYVLDVASGAVTPMVRNTPGLQVDWGDWTPEGTHVIYDARDDPAGGSRLVRRHVATGQERELFRTPRLLRALAVSPDGTQIVIELEGALHLIPTDGGALRELRPASREGGIASWASLSWSRDGRHVLFLRTPADGTEVALRSIDVASGREEATGFVWPELTDAVLGVGSVAFVNGQKKYEVWVLENFLRGMAARR